jgi:hypothetical protein
LDLVLIRTAEGATFLVVVESNVQWRDQGQENKGK